MNRYIDAEKFEKEMYHEAFETDSDMQKCDRGCQIRYKMFENCIAQQPTADVVKVVRCKDCACFDRQRFSGDKGYCKRFRGGRNEMNYCDFGYREEVE